jgi:hypothetical protein
VDAHRDDGRRFIVESDKALSAFWAPGSESRESRDAIGSTATPHLTHAIIIVVI